VKVYSLTLSCTPGLPLGPHFLFFSYICWCSSSCWCLLCFGFHRVVTCDYHVIGAYHVPNVNNVIGAY
jgi:hypothetical protein